jgi:hypothetical protein
VNACQTPHISLPSPVFAEKKNQRNFRFSAISPFFSVFIRGGLRVQRRLMKTK